MKIRKILLSLLLFISLSNLTYAQSALNTTNVTNAIVKSFDNERIVVGATAIGFTTSKINPTVTDQPSGFSRAQVATCVNGSNSIVILTTSGTPTSTNGLLVAAGQAFTVYGYDDISNFLAIRVSSSSNIDCVYSRPK